MPAPPGCKKTGGRKKGTPNKQLKPLMEKAQMMGIDPFEALLMFAAGDWKGLGYQGEYIEKHTQYGTNYTYTIEPSVRAKAAAEACSYLYPKRKAIDLIHNPEDEDRPLEDLTDEELDAL